MASERAANRPSVTRRPESAPPRRANELHGLRQRAESELRSNARRGRRRRPLQSASRKSGVRPDSQSRHPRTASGEAALSEADTRRLVHELQVHQLELEMQNSELQKARDEAGAALEKYTGLYDFTPVGCFSLDHHGSILEANLTGALLLGLDRSRLLQRRLITFLAPASRPLWPAFLEQVRAQSKKQVLEAELVKPDGTTFWGVIQGASAPSWTGPQNLCRVAISDITALKHAEIARSQMQALMVANRALQREIVQRQAAEATLRQTQERQDLLLEKSRRMQEQLRRLSHRVLQAQEEERKRISRELHDDISQVLIGIHVHLEALARQVTVDPSRLRRQIARAQKVVKQSVSIVHQFARELRPATLDDIGLVAALHAHLKDFMTRTGLRARLAVFSSADQLSNAHRTTLYRVAQSALANIAQHAHASKVSVSLRRLPKAVVMEIIDNGCGFAVDQTLEARTTRRLGLVGMRERLEMVGGELQIASAPGQGTTIRMQIPLGSSPSTRKAST